jgi:hypothetical protein
MKRFARHGSLLRELTTLMVWGRSQTMSFEPLNVECMTSMKRGEYSVQRN